MTGNPTEQWIAYYDHARLESWKRPLYWLNRLMPNSFQRVMVREIARRLEQRPPSDSPCRVLSAGAGVDFVSHHLKRRMGNRIEILVLDASERCIEMNRRLFGDRFRYMTADLLSVDLSSQTFDVVFNTGLLEHFSTEDQRRLTAKLLNVLSPGGYYITANPSMKGRLYRHCMQRARIKGTWPFGDETPVDSLAPLARDRCPLVAEYTCCSLVQLSFLYCAYRAFFLAVLPLVLAARFLSLGRLDRLLSHLLGDYLQVSVFERAQDAAAKQGQQVLCLGTRPGTASER